jgi:hypothetical protein
MAKAKADLIPVQYFHLLKQGNTIVLDNQQEYR